jgi:hypothetical protein
MRFFLLAMMAIISGCGESDNPPITGTTDPSVIIGSWETNCDEAMYETETIWTVSNYSITENTIDKVDSHFLDENCSTSYSGDLNPFEGYSGSYSYLGNIDTSSGLKALWLQLTVNVDPSLESDIIINSGFYVDNDVLYQVLESEGSYNIIYAIPYYKQ